MEVTMRTGSRFAPLFGFRRRPSLQLPPVTILSALSHSCASPEDYLQISSDCNDFLPWLQQKSGQEISSMLSVGHSTYGRSLFASKYIEAGECILKVPYSVHITPDKILREVASLISTDVGNIGQLAVVLLTEKKLGQDSAWTSYINNLPLVEEMHNTAFEHFPQILGNYVLQDFMHAYALVGSRAWGTTKGLSLIPFADFLNHDGTSESILLSDEDKETSEVIADRDYNVGEQVLIRYGKFSNATLLLDFGFTLMHNIHDQVQIWMDIPQHDSLRTEKLDLLHKHGMPMISKTSDFHPSGISFVIKEVRSANGNGKGIPQPLRAFVRVLSATSKEALEGMASEAAKNDGRLARRPLEDKNLEIQAHRILLSHIIHLIQDYDSSIESLGPTNINNSRFSLRRKLARDLLTGEHRVLHSVCTWLTNYCNTG